MLVFNEFAVAAKTTPISPSCFEHGYGQGITGMTMREEMVRAAYGVRVMDYVEDMYNMITPREGTVKTVIVNVPAYIAAKEQEAHRDKFQKNARSAHYAYAISLWDCTTEDEARAAAEKYAAAKIEELREAYPLPDVEEELMEEIAMTAVGREYASGYEVMFVGDHSQYVDVESMVYHWGEHNAIFPAV